MDNSQSFHKIWVIESLPAGELRTGRILVEGTLYDAKQKHPHLEIEFRTPQTKNDLLALLKTIYDEAAALGKYPMIHLECHGCPTGLRVANGELVKWTDLRTLLIQINYACRLNLVIVLAACNGAHLIKVATRLDRAPFWAVIGPLEEVKAGDIERDFAAFYSSFLEKLNGDAAMIALNKNNPGSNCTYHLFSATGLFTQAYKRYLSNNSAGKRRTHRIEALLTQALKTPAIRQIGTTRARKLIKQELTKEEQFFNKTKNQFFFIDSFPENAARFSFSYLDILSNLN